MSDTPDKQTLENYARKFAYVPYQDHAYNEDLHNTLNSLKSIYQKYVSTRNDEALETVKQSIEAVIEAQDFKDKVRSFFSRDTLKQTKAQGDILLSKRKDFEKFRNLMKERCNMETELFYSIGNANRTFEQLIRKYENLMEEKLMQISEHYTAWVENTDQTRADMLEMICNKGESEGKEALSPMENSLFLENLENSLGEEMKGTCQSYQRAKHDCLLARTALEAYSPLESINENAVVLLNEMVEYASKQVAAVESVINIYEVVTMEEINLLKQSNFHPKFVEKVNQLVESIGEVDYKMRENIIKVLTEQVPPINLPEADKIVAGMVKHLNAVKD